ncbi:hypothetical protein OIO90_003367 [Microbotryomycetes sp. JL221]|nr:hypothetical protein OIO90_003367 [Microbotryomycetes sp. JL221]
MPPAARLSLPYAKRTPSISIAPARFRIQGWDPILIVSQIVSLQALHYLTLAVIVPLLVSAFANPALLAEEGGASSVSIVMDWREFTGRSTASLAAKKNLAPGLVGLTVLTTGKGPGGTGPDGALTSQDIIRGLIRVIESDSGRGWAVALGWSLGAMVNVLWLYHLVRRPTHILDFSLTLIFNHLILTTYYASSFPTSFFFWFVLTVSTVVQIVIAEQLCVRRELRDGFTIDTTNTPIPLTPETRRSPLTPMNNGSIGPSSSSTLGPSPLGPGGQKRRDEIEMDRLRSMSRSPGGHVSSGSNGGSGGMLGPATALNMGGSGTNQYERVPTDDRRD